MTTVLDPIEVGGAAEIIGRFYTYPGGVKTLTNPPALSFEYIEPDGTPVTVPNGDPAILHDGTGLYRIIIAASDDGVWRGRWVVSGGASGAQSVTWCVLASAFV